MAQATSDSSSDGDGQFNKTHWTVILTLAWTDPRSPDYQKACEQFYKAYWKPVYFYVRKKGRSHEQAEDLTQEFFVRLLYKKVLAGLTRKGGKFRAFLLTVLKRFLASDWKRPVKGGWGAVHIPIDETAEACYQKELSDQETPEDLYDRKWAHAVLQKVILDLSAEYAAKGEGKVFECLKGRLPGAQQEISYEDASRTLDMKVEAVRMAASRLKRRFKELLYREVATPGMSRQEVEEEIRHLMAALCRH